VKKKHPDQTMIDASIHLMILDRHKIRLTNASIRIFIPLQRLTPLSICPKSASHLE